MTNPIAAVAGRPRSLTFYSVGEVLQWRARNRRARAMEATDATD